MACLAWGPIGSVIVPILYFFWNLYCDIHCHFIGFVYQLLLIWLKLKTRQEYKENMNKNYKIIKVERENQVSAKQDTNRAILENILGTTILE